MLCIYCNECEATAREHYLPQCLGRFQNYEPLLNRLCVQCNQQIGGDVEREFCRRSPEAVLRSTHWIKGQDRGGQKRRQAYIFQPEKIGGRHLYFLGPDPESGRNILWQTDDKPGAVKEISQVVILDSDGNAIEHIPIPIGITTGGELIQILFKKRNATSIGKALVIAASGDEERVKGLFLEIQVDVSLERRNGGRVPKQYFKAELTPAYFRALAKIGFHYALKYIPAITGNEDAFRSLRDFIRKGIGDTSQFLRSRPAASSSTGSPGHCLSALARPNSDITVDMQFFARCKTSLPQWQLTLGPSPTALFVKQASAHLFTYVEDDDGRLNGSEVVTLSLPE